jgi:hypothetical protein
LITKHILTTPPTLSQRSTVVFIQLAPSEGEANDHTLKPNS